MSNAEAMKWRNFFIGAGIPVAIATRYSKTFSEQRIHFSMLDEIDKNTLIQLGVTAIGDQIAILKNVRLAVEKKNEISSKSIEKKVSFDTSASPSNQSLAPDRDDIYHVRLPTGNTPKTKAIMKKHDMLRTAGILKRGFTGVRKSGKDIRPISEQILKKTSHQGNGITFRLMQTAEVSSTTDNFYERLGVRGLVSDSIKKPVVKPKSPRRSLFQTAIDETTSEAVVEPVFRVRLPSLQERVSVVVPKRIPMTKKNYSISSGFVAKYAQMPSRNLIVTTSSSKRIRQNIRGRISVFDRLS